MEGHNYSHACHTTICRLLSSVINRDNGIEISGAHEPTIYPVPGDHKVESRAKWCAVAAGQYIMVWTAENTAYRTKGKVGRPAIYSEDQRASTTSNHTAARLAQLEACRSAGLLHGRPSVHTPAGLSTKVFKIW